MLQTRNNVCEGRLLARPLTRMDEPLAKRPWRPTGLKLLDVTFRPSDAKECKEADVAPTPATCRDPDGAASALDPAAELAKGLTEGAERVLSAAAAADIMPPAEDPPSAPETSPTLESGQPAEMSQEMDRLLQSSPGTPERLSSIDALLASIGALRQRNYAAVCPAITSATESEHDGGEA
eukprot:516028-Prymnesium_polylepis.2